MECEGYDRMEAYYKAREGKLKEEIADLRDKAGDFGLHNDYLDCKVYELEDALEHKKRCLRDHMEKEKRYGFRKMMLESHCNMLDDEDITPLDVPTDPPTVMQGPMTRARMRQLNLEVSSFLSDSFSYF